MTSKDICRRQWQPVSEARQIFEQSELSKTTGNQNFRNQTLVLRKMKRTKWWKLKKEEFPVAFRVKPFETR